MVGPKRLPVAPAPTLYNSSWRAVKASPCQIDRGKKRGKYLKNKGLYGRLYHSTKGGRLC